MRKGDDASPRCEGMLGGAALAGGGGPMPRQSVSISDRTFVANAGDDGLLFAKITRPDLPNWIVARDRVGKLIARGARRTLTVVTGPPGAGKTMALASWCAASTSPRPLAWLSVDRYDNRPQAFWYYFVTALRQAGVRLPRPGRMWSAGEWADHAFVHRLASALATQDPPATIIVDDIHLLTEPAPLDELAYLLRQSGSGLRLVTSARMDPLLPLHRFRLTGDLTEIRAADLAFTVPEAGLLMARHGITLSPNALRTLTQRGEGWAAGLRLAALSMRGHGDPDELAAQFGGDDSTVRGYIVGEVLDVQPTAARDLLLKTCVVERVNDELACDLTGDRHAAATLAALAESSGFVQPLGRGWYRYHALLGEVLRLKLRHDAQCDVPELHRRAAQWFRGQGMLAEAVHQATRAEDWDLAGRTVVDELAVGRLLEPHPDEPLADEARSMQGEEILAHPPALLVAAAMTVRDRALESGSAMLSAADCALDRLPADQQVSARFAAAQIRLTLARQRGDLDSAKAAADEERELLNRVPDSVLSRHPEARAQVLASRGAVDLWDGRFDSAADVLDEGAACDGAVIERADCLGQLALVEAIQGRLGHAAQLAATVPPDSEHAMVPGPQAAAEVAAAWAHLEHDGLDDSRIQLALADDALRARPDKLVGAVAYLVAARHSLATGRPSSAAELVERARHGWTPPLWLAQRLILAECHARTAAGDASPFVAAARSVQPGAEPATAIAMARALLSTGDQAAADRVLAAALLADLPEDIGLEARLLEAALRFRAGEAQLGRSAFRRALRIAQPERRRLAFKLEKPWLGPALKREPGLAHELKTFLDPGDATTRLIQGAAHRMLADQPPHPPIEQLSQREREVLQSASTMLSTAEIAAEMYLSVNTVKSHFRSIFRKLGASRRGEAVRRARELELI